MNLSVFFIAILILRLESLLALFEGQWLKHLAFNLKDHIEKGKIWVLFATEGPYVYKLYKFLGWVSKTFIQ